MELGRILIRSGTWNWVAAPLENVFQGRTEYKVFGCTDPDKPHRQLMRQLVGSFGPITAETAAQLARHAQSRSTWLPDGTPVELEFVPAPPRATPSSISWSERLEAKLLRVAVTGREPALRDVGNDFLLGDLTEDEIQELVLELLSRPLRPANPASGADG